MYSKKSSENNFNLDAATSAILLSFGRKENLAIMIVVIVYAGLNSYTLCLLYVRVYVLCVMLLYSFPVWLFPYYVISYVLESVVCISIELKKYI